jgi:hypothetical protein
MIFCLSTSGGKPWRKIEIWNVERYENVRGVAAALLMGGAAIPPRLALSDGQVARHIPKEA